MTQQGPGIIKRKEALRRDEINEVAINNNTHCENFNIVIAYIMQAAYSEPYQRSKMECFTKIFNDIKAVDYFRKKFHLRTLQGSEYASGC